MSAALQKLNKRSSPTVFGLLLATIVVIFEIMLELCKLFRGCVKEVKQPGNATRPEICQQTTGDIAPITSTEDVNPKCIDLLYLQSRSIFINAPNAKVVEINIGPTPLQHYYKIELMHRLLEKRKIHRFERVRRKLQV